MLTSLKKSISVFTLKSNQICKFTTTSASSVGSQKKKTYYQILEIPSSANLNNIKQNYLRLAKIYHPDVYKGKDK